MGATNPTQAYNTSAFNMLMATSFKPLTHLVDLWTFDKKEKNEEKKQLNLKKTQVRSFEEFQSNNYQESYPTAIDYHCRRQLLTWITHPVDDLIRYVSIPYFATAGHFCNIWNCFEKKNCIEGSIRILTTPVWWPLKIVLKVAVFTPFLAIQTPISFIIPYRTIITCRVPTTACNTGTSLGRAHDRLEICQEFEKNPFYPFKAKEGIKGIGPQSNRISQIMIVARYLFVL